jgi:hypothetical protein
MRSTDESVINAKDNAIKSIVNLFYEQKNDPNDLLTVLIEIEDCQEIDKINSIVRNFHKKGPDKSKIQNAEELYKLSALTQIKYHRYKEFIFSIQREAALETFQLVEFSNELILNIHEYVQNKHTNINFYKVVKNQFNLVYYNNFEILKISEYTNENYLSFYEYLDSKNGFLKYRWGDHAVRFLYNNLFIKQEQIIYYNDLPYFHHFDLKNRPFILNNYF